MRVGVVCERFPGERRVALVPASIPLLKRAGLDVVFESGAGQQAGFPDHFYREKSVEIAVARADVFAAADVILQVRSAGAAGEQGRADLPMLRSGQTVIADPVVPGFRLRVTLPPSLKLRRTAVALAKAVSPAVSRLSSRLP